jgi:serine/threonine-protein kinase HipA
VKICPITYEEFSDPGKYSKRGLRLFSRNLSSLTDLPYDAEEQRKEAIARAPKMSVQGVQLKLSARLDIQTQSFILVDIGGLYILKPPSALYRELPENEDLTMRLAASVGIEVPLHGLIYSKDGSRTYIVKRFDRQGRGGKLALEDFAQLSGRSRETKYDSSMEQVAEVIKQFATFPILEHIKLLKRTLVNFLLGNEDMHLKNFSLIARDGKIELSPAYDLVNTTIALKDPREEIALPIGGRKKKLTRSLILQYYAIERLKLSQKVVDSTLEEIRSGMQAWEQLIDRSFLGTEMKKRYREVVTKRQTVLGFRT